MSELMLVTAIFASGWSLLSGLGLRGWGTIPLSMLIGPMQIVCVGAVLLISGIGAMPWTVVLVTLGASGAVLALSPKPASWRMLLAGMVILVPLVAVLRTTHLVTYHIDSFRYLVASGLLATDRYELASADLLEKRLLAAPILHSLAHIHGEWYLRSITPLMGLAVIGLLVWVLSQTQVTKVPRWALQSVVAMSALLLLTNHRYVWHSFYINDHLFFASALLVSTSGSLLLVKRALIARTSLVGAQVVALTSLVVTRPEGFIVGFLVVVPFLLSASVSRRERTLVAGSFLIAVVSWFTYTTVFLHDPGQGLPLARVAPAMSGLLGLAALSILQWNRLVAYRDRLLWGFEGLLWLCLILASIRHPSVLIDSLAATFRNIVGGQGYWGGSLLALGLMGLGALALARDRSLVLIRFPLTTLIPVLLLLAFLRDGAYRVGPGDSLNRMLIQPLPLLVLFIAASFLSFLSAYPSRIPRRPKRFRRGRPHPETT